MIAQRPRSLGPYAASAAAGLVLLSAAAVKAIDLALVPHHSFLQANWVNWQTNLIAAETCLGIWLLAGFYPRAGRSAGAVVFALFAGAAFRRAWQGATSCQCFGRLAVDPRYTVALDIAICAVLILLGLRGAGSSRPWVRVTLVSAVLTAPAGAWLIRYIPTSSLEGGDPALIEPSRWVGSWFPLLEYTDLKADLRTGRWVVILYNGRCPHCQSALPDLQTWATNGRAWDNSLRLALVEVPPFTSGAGGLVVSETGWLRGSVTVPDSWVMPIPMVVLLQDGRVQKVFERESALDLTRARSAVSKQGRLATNAANLDAP